jgi:hypothetical protein
MEAQDSDLSNETATLADILKWSADLPAWQPDALGRLCGQTVLPPKSYPHTNVGRFRFPMMLVSYWRCFRCRQ